MKIIDERDKKWTTLLINPEDDVELISKTLCGGQRIDLSTGAGWITFGVGWATANKRIGSTPTQRLRWLLELIQKLPESLDSDDRWLEILGFVSSDRAFIAMDVESYRPQKLSSVLADLEKSLRRLVREKVWRLDSPREPAAFTIVRKFKNRKQTGALFGSLDASMAFLFKVDELIAIEGGRVEECASSECGRLFVKRKAAIFCQARCNDREKKRRWRKELGNVKVNEIQREHYRKKSGAAQLRKGVK